MASFHTIKASPPHRPGGPETPSTSVQGHYFGWEILRRIQKPPAEMKRISPTDVTPTRTLRAMSGELNPPPQQPAANPRGRRERVVPEYERLKLEREQRKLDARLERSRGNGKGGNHYERP